MSTIKLEETQIAQDEGCCYQLCRCLYPEDPKSQTKVVSVVSPVNEKVNQGEFLNSNHPSNMGLNNINYNNNNNKDEDEIILHAKNSTKNFLIDTQISNCMIEFDIKMKRDERIDIIYNCPICTRYFNYILTTSCCSNYICKFCADDYLSTMIKYQNIIKCPICNVQKQVILTDFKYDSEVS